MVPLSPPERRNPEAVYLTGTKRRLSWKQLVVSSYVNICISFRFNETCSLQTQVLPVPAHEPARAECIPAENRAHQSCPSRTPLVHWNRSAKLRSEANRKGQGFSDPLQLGVAVQTKAEDGSEGRARAATTT